MLLIILFGILLGMGVVLYRLGCEDLSIFLSIIGGVCLAITIALLPLILIGENVFRDITYPEMIQTLKQSEGYEDLGKDIMLKADIRTINKHIMNTQYFVDSPWVGIYYSRDVANLELIDINI